MSTATKKTTVHEININHITADSELQPRSNIDLDVVREYSDAMIEGDQFPPLIVFYDGITYWLADGFHRYRAAIKAAKTSVRCTVYQGGRDEAILYSVGANASHGIRRTSADKRRVILKMLDHPEWCLWSDAEIARRCHVSASSVSRYRNNSPGLAGHDVTLRVNRNGDVYECRSGDEAQEPMTPEPRYSIPPTPLSKAELGEQYARKITRHLKSLDSSTRTKIETPFGIADMVDSKRAYILATAHDRHTMFAAIGRAWLTAEHLKKAPAVIGHFNRSLTGIAKAAAALGFLVCSPEALIAESEV